MSLSGNLKSRRMEWAEFSAENGRKYFYNRITGVSTWEKPNELKTNAELALAACVWKEYISDAGRKYFYNIDTKESSWEEPQEHKILREALEEESRRLQEQTTNSPVDTGGSVYGAPRSPTTMSPSSPTSESKQEPVYRTQEERMEVFKKLLEHHGVTSTWTWDMTMRSIANDERYKVLKTLSEKKQALSEYQGERRKHEREEKRKKDNKARESFVKMLKECEHINSKMPWRKAMAYFEGDLRNEAVPEREREDLYEEFLAEREKQEKEAARQVRKEKMKKFRVKLDADPNININSQWRKIKEQFKDDEAFKSLDKIDRLSVFEEYIRELEREEEDKKREELYHKKKISRKNRDAYRALLNEKYEEGLLSMNTKWKDFQKLIREDERYKVMVDSQQIGSLPCEIFGDFLDDLEERYYQEKNKIKEILKEFGLVLSAESNVDQILAEISKSPKFGTLDIKFVNQILLDWIRKEDEEQKKKIKEIEKKKKKDFGKFIDLLCSTKNIRFNASWVEVRELLKDDPAFLAIPSEAERESLFQDFITKKQEDTSDEEGRIRDESPKDKKDRKHKRSSKKEKKHKHHRKHKDNNSSGSEDDQTKRRKKDYNLDGGEMNTLPKKVLERESSPEEGEAR